MGPAEHPPEAMIAFVAQQLGVIRPPPSPITRSGTRPAASMPSNCKSYLGLRSFGLVDWRACLQVGTDAAWATDRGEPIVQAMLAHLRANNVLVPAAAVLERIGLAARARARKRTFQALAEGLTDAERDTLARSADGRSGTAPFPLRLAAGLFGVACALQHRRAA